MTETNTIDAPITLEHTALVNYGVEQWLDALQKGVDPRTICVLGKPGIGKSAAAKAMADRMTAYVRRHPTVVFGEMPETESIKDDDERMLAQQEIAIQRLREARIEEALNEQIRAKLEAKEWTVEDIEAEALLLDFTSKLPEDLGGLPFRSEDGYTDYCPQRWVARLSRKFAFGVYCQDDLPAAPQAMQVAGRQAALERRIHEHYFTRGVIVMVTGNRREDKAAAGTLPSHFRNSVTMLAIEPSLDEWKKWYGKQPGVASIVPAFLSWKTELFSESPGDSKDKLGAFATPRQWFSLGQQFDVANRCGEEVLLAVASGVVGKGNALTFCGFVEVVSTLVPPEEVLDDPKGAMPKPLKTLDEPSKRCAMATALGERAAARWKKLKGPEKDEVPGKLLDALAWTSQAGDEYSAVGVQTFLDMGGNLTAIARMARKAKNDPVIGRLLDHVKKALLNV